MARVERRVPRAAAHGAVLAAMSAILLTAGALDAAGAASTTTTITTTIGPATTTATVATTTAPAPTTTTTVAATTTTTPPPPNLLAGVDWIEEVYPSPCGDGTNVQMIGGSAIVGGMRAVLDDVAAIDPTHGVAVTFLSCHQPNGTVSHVVALPVTVSTPGGHPVPGTATELGAGARVVTTSPGAFVVELPDPVAPTALLRRRGYAVGATGISLASDRQVSVLERTITLPPAVGEDVRLIEANVQRRDVCYSWNDVSLSAQDPPAPDNAEPIPAPSAEIQTIRLALILLTGQWIDPTSEMTPQMAAVTKAYQASRGLDVDGVIGRQTTDALAADLGCPANTSFRMIVPPELGPRRYATPRALLDDVTRFVHTGRSADPSLDTLLRAASWDGANSLFLGCSRYESPVAGLACAWSGTTPLQLVGLVDDPATVGVRDFSVLYARSAAPA